MSTFLGLMVLPGAATSPASENNLWCHCCGYLTYVPSKCITWAKYRKEPSIDCKVSVPVVSVLYHPPLVLTGVPKAGFGRAVDAHLHILMLPFQLYCIIPVLISESQTSVIQLITTQHTSSCEIYKIWPHVQTNKSSHKARVLGY